MIVALLQVLTLLAGGPAAASQIDVEQVGAADAPGSAMRDIDALQLGDRKPVVEPAEPSPAPAPMTQLNQEGRTAAPPVDQPQTIPFARPEQVNVQRATAEAPVGPPVPRPRQTTVEPVAGDDICDPAKPGDKGDEACANRIETRAAEFAAAPAAPVISAEERLLGDGHEPGSDARASARRLAGGEVADSEAAQAYVFTSGLTPQTDAAGAAPPSSQTQKAIDAATRLLGTLPPSAVVTTR